jgi:hypothetical protein
LGEKVHSRSWKLTQPLRRSNALARQIRERVAKLRASAESPRVA